MKKNIKLTLFNVFYVLAMIPLVYFSGYEILRVKSANSPMNWLPIAACITLTCVFSLINIRKNKNRDQA